MKNSVLVKNYTAGAGVAPFRIVKFGADDKTVVQAAADTDALIGVSNDLGGDSGERVDVETIGVAEVEYGGDVTRGALLTSGADGKAIATAPGAGTNMSVIGRAMAAGADGEIGSVLLAPSQIQG